MASVNRIHYFPITIPISSTDSNEIDLAGMTCVGIFTPSAITGTALLFKAAREPGITPVAVIGTDGNALSYTMAASKFIQFTASALIGVRAITIVSGSTELAARTFWLACRPIR